MYINFDKKNDFIEKKKGINIKFLVSVVGVIYLFAWCFFLFLYARILHTCTQTNTYMYNVHL